MAMLFPSEVVWGEVCFSSVCSKLMQTDESASELETPREECAHTVFTVTPAASFMNTQSTVNTSGPASLRQYILIFASR